MERISDNFITNVYKGAEMQKKTNKYEITKISNKNFKTF